LDFFRAWDEVVGRLRDSRNNLPITELPMRRDMERLHKIRNDVQHSSAIPHPQDVQKYPALVESFLKDSYQDIFKVDYDSISLLSLIKDHQIKEQLEKAHTALNSGDWNKVAIESAIGFSMLMELTAIIAIRDPISSLYASIDRFSFSNDFGQRRQIERIVEEIDDLREHLLLTACGIDYVEYLKYRHICPSVRQMVDGQYDTTRSKDYSEDESKSILNFVENQVLQFQVSGIYRDLAEQIRKDPGY